MSEPREHPLPAELDHWYSVAGHRYHQFLEAVTALDLGAARRHLGLFSRLLLGTLEVSESGFEEVSREQGGEEDGELVRTDFMILRRSLTGLNEALDQLDAAGGGEGSLRSAMVDRLDTFVRTANILARHHDRVESILIPLLERRLSHERSREMAEALNASMQRAQPN